MEKSMYHFVYETTNLINGKKYIGKHSTENLNDSYLGSGIALNRAIKKYGEESFKRSIIRQFKTSDEALEYESLIVTEDIVNSKEYYNMRQGGKGGTYTYTDADKAKMSNSAKERIKRIGHNLLGKHRSEESKRKLSEFYKGKPGNPIQCNAMKAAVKGSSWWNNGIINKRIRVGDTPPDGFVKGRLK